MISWSGDVRKGKLGASTFNKSELVAVNNNNYV